MTKALVIGNWKMNMDYVEAIHLVQQLGVLVRGQTLDHTEVAVAPPFVDLRSVTSVIEADRLPVVVAAQHVHSADAGAFTGEISVAMLKRLGVKYVLVGHSERRSLFGMTDAVVSDTAAAVIQGGMTAVICCGETFEERELDRTTEVLQHQLQIAFSKINTKNCDRVVIAYEPVWAIGSGTAATTEDISLACKAIDSAIPSSWPTKPRILYGGSVNSENCGSIVENSPVDGFLVGGASLKADDFSAIVGITNACYRR